MRFFALVCLSALIASQASAQLSTHPCTSGEGGWNPDSICEVRAATLPLSGGHLGVNGMNGGIEVLGEDRRDVALEAQVTAHAPSREEAESILHEITITTGGTIEAHGPHTSNGRNWSVNYKLHVPHHLAARLRTENGSLTLADIEGEIDATTMNGSVKLHNLAGDVRIGTTNGSIRGELEGNTWHGKGLSAQTTNGSVAVTVPQQYSAHLIASTVNGHTSVGGLATSGGELRRNRLDTNLGSGGPTLNFETVNGSVSVR